MNIIEKLKSFGVEITSEMEKTFAGDFLSELEVEKKLGKAEKERDSWKDRAETAEEILKGFEGKDFDGITKDRDAWKEKFENLEREQKEAAAKAERAELVAEFLKDTVFVNDITKNAITVQLEESLSKDTAKGKSVEDLFNEIVKDKEGKLLPNIIIEETQQQAEQRRSSIIKRTLNNQNTGTKLSTAELMRMKNENPNLDISQYLK